MTFFQKLFKEKKQYVSLPFDMDSNFKKYVFDSCKDYTMTSPERVFALYKAVEYITKANISGDFVECGVWKGGSAMAMALALSEFGDTKRKIYLYDTFAGMTKPTNEDFTIADKTPAIKKWKSNQEKWHNSWAFSSIEEVKRNVFSTGYPREKFFFVKGDIEKTIPETMPKEIALLRLDTDWFASTYHELKHLFPLLAKNGVIILDDYGHWAGAKKAVDKYFKENNTKILLNRIDYTCRIGTKNCLS